MFSNRIFGAALHLPEALLHVTGNLLQTGDRPGTPHGLRVTIDNGVATARWEQVEGASLYRLVLRSAAGPNGAELRRQLWAPQSGKASISLIIPCEFVVPGVPVRLHLTAKKPSTATASRPATFRFLPPAGLAHAAGSGIAGVDGGRRNRLAQNGIPVGAMGKIFRENGVLSIYEAVSPARGALVLQVTQEEVEAAIASGPGTADVKVSDDRRVAISLLPNRYLDIAMGPNPEGKTLHTVPRGGLFGQVYRTFTTCDARPPGHLLPRMA